MFRGNRLTESKARTSQRNQKFLLKCSHLTFLPNRQDPTKHMGGGDEERLGFDLEYRSLCKIWQGHSCLKRSNPPLWEIWSILPSKEGKLWQLVKMMENVDVNADFIKSAHCWGQQRQIWASHGWVECMRCTAVSAAERREAAGQRDAGSLKSATVAIWWIYMTIYWINVRFGM